MKIRWIDPLVSLLLVGYEIQHPKIAKATFFCTFLVVVLHVQIVFTQNSDFPS